MSLIDRLLGRKSKEDSASMAKKRLSILVHSDTCNAFSRELEKRIKQTVLDFYEEEGLKDNIDYADLCHELKEEGLLEVSIPLPDSVS